MMFFYDPSGFIDETVENESNEILKDYGLGFECPEIGDGGEDFFNFIDLWLPAIKDLLTAFAISGAYDVIKSAILNPIKKRKDLKHPDTTVSIKFENGDVFSLQDPDPETIDIFFDSIIEFEKKKEMIVNKDNEER